MNSLLPPRWFESFLAATSSRSPLFRTAREGAFELSQLGHVSRLDSSIQKIRTLDFSSRSMASTARCHLPPHAILVPVSQHSSECFRSLALLVSPSSVSATTYIGRADSWGRAGQRSRERGSERCMCPPCPFSSTHDHERTESGAMAATCEATVGGVLAAALTPWPGAPRRSAPFR